MVNEFEWATMFFLTFFRRFFLFRMNCFRGPARRRGEFTTKSIIIIMKTEEIQWSATRTSSTNTSHPQTNRRSATNAVSLYADDESSIHHIKRDIRA